MKYYFGVCFCCKHYNNKLSVRVTATVSEPRSTAHPAKHRRARMAHSPHSQAYRPSRGATRCQKWGHEKLPTSIAGDSACTRKISVKFKRETVQILVI